MGSLAARLPAYVMLGLAGLLGGGSLLVFTLFLFAGSLGLVELRLSDSGVLWLDAGLCLAFFVQHSGMVRKSFRRRLGRFVPGYYHAAVYSIASGVVLLGLVVLWQESAITLAAPQGIMRWLLRAVYFLSMAGFVWGVRALGFFDPLGRRAILHHLRGTAEPRLPFAVRGPFRWVRHPLYLFCLLMIWSCPDVTADRLLFNVLWTGWMIAGTVLEERDLVAAFGDTYRDYQRKVPMLVPYRFRPGR